MTNNPLDKPAALRLLISVNEGNVMDWNIEGYFCCTLTQRNKLLISNNDYKWMELLSSSNEVNVCISLRLQHPRKSIASAEFQCQRWQGATACFSVWLLLFSSVQSVTAVPSMELSLKQAWWLLQMYWWLETELVIVVWRYFWQGHHIFYYTGWDCWVASFVCLD